MKIGPADSEIIDIQEILKKKLTSAKYIARLTSFPSELKMFAHFTVTSIVTTKSITDYRLFLCLIHMFVHVIMCASSSSDVSREKLILDE